MKVTYNWLKDFVTITLKPQELAQKLTMAGLEVVSLEQKDGDWVYEIEITGNRPDWLSVMGIAREVAALTGTKMKVATTLPRHKAASKETLKVSVHIENVKDCPLYTARIIRDVVVKESPQWLQKRLELVGIRPVNNIVDITNYVLLETGEPLHAFDLDKLAHDQAVAITVRRSRAKETITAIDGKTRELDATMLIIADSLKPVAVAGVIGGKDTEVSDSTKNILLEAAKFSPVLIRRTRQALGISTESSYRFERDVDAGSVGFASTRALGLIQEIAHGTPALFLSQPKKGISTSKKTITLSLQKVRDAVGADIPVKRIKNILQHLGLSVAASKAVLRVGSPSFRRDLAKDIDLIEEICRIYGYEHIPTTTPSLIPQEVSAGVFDFNMLTRRIMVGLGVDEAITHSLVSREFLQKAACSESGVALANPLSNESEVLRPTIIPSLLTSVARNLNRNQPYIQLFEVAKRFLGAENERYALSFVLCGKKTWCSEKGKREEELGLFHLKGIIEVLLARLGIEKFELVQKEAGIMSGNSFGLMINGTCMGIFGEIKQDVLNAFDIKNQKVFAAEVALEDIYKVMNLKHAFVNLPQYPAVVRDLTILVQQGIGIKELLSQIYESGKPIIQDARLADVYAGGSMAPGSRSLTFSCTYQLRERTLQDNEVNAVHKQVVDSLVSKFSAQLR